MLTVSNPERVIAQCCAGIVGASPALNARPQPALRGWLARIQEALAAQDAGHIGQPAAPFAVNLIVHRSNERLEEDLAVLAECKVPLVITSLSARPEVNEAVHGYGGLVFHDVINNRFARKAIEKGADGLIAVAAGAGGHGGIQSPFALVQEIRAWFDGPLLLPGAIANGRSVLVARALGADLAYIGSAFIATREASAGGAYKRMVVDSSAKDIAYTDRFSGVYDNDLRGSIEASGYDPDNLSTRIRPHRQRRRSLRSQGVAGYLGCPGQGFGAVDSVSPTADVVARRAREYAEAVAALALPQEL